MQEHKQKNKEYNKHDSITFLEATEKMDDQLLHEETNKSDTYLLLSLLIYKIGVIIIPNTGVVGRIK